MSNKILLDNCPMAIYVEGVVNSSATYSFTPGVLVAVDWPTGIVTAYSGSITESFYRDEQKFIAVEDAIEHPDIHEPYKRSNKVFMARPMPGSLVNLAVLPGTPVIGQNNALYNYVSNDNRAGCSATVKGRPFAVAIERMDNSSGTEIKFIKARML